MMKENPDTNSEKIADYLENRMNAAEETSFMEELGRDEELRKSFEEELLIRQILTEHGPAETHFSYHKPDPPTAHRPLIPLWRIRTIAAACLAIIFASVGIAHWTGSHHPDLPAGESILSENSPRQTDKIPPALNTDTLFNRYYTAYTENNDPVEVSVYYQHYRKHDYAAVLAAQKEDYLLMGTDSKTKVLHQYMQLYKGLSYLADHQPVQAQTQFDSLLRSSPPSTAVYYAAQWYNTLSWLKRKDISGDAALANATRSATAIIHSASPYKQKADRLLNSLLNTQP